MERVKRLWFRHERPLLLLAVLALFGVVYCGAAVLPPWRPRVTLAWDPVWLVPYVPAFVLPYLTLFLMPLPLLSKAVDIASFRRLAKAFTAVILVSGVFFLALPLAPPRPPDVGAGAFGRIVAAMYGIDAPTNLFPSLHVSVSFLCAFGAARFMTRLRTAAIILACVIAASTMLVRQHYAIDVAGGFVLAWIAWRSTFPRARGPETGR